MSVVLVYFDMHIVGVPVSYDCKRGMKKQVVNKKKSL